MINLLPENNKKELDREYTYRHAVVALWSALALIVVALVVMVPAYILTLYKGMVETSTVPTDEIAKNEADFKKQLEETKLLINVLKPKTGITLPSNVITLLDKHKTTKNTITSLTYVVSDAGTLVDVRGIAKTRESLSVFTDALRKEGIITKVDVPVSNFAKDTNIAYTFSIQTK